MTHTSDSLPQVDPKPSLAEVHAEYRVLADLFDAAMSADRVLTAFGRSGPSLCLHGDLAVECLRDWARRHGHEVADHRLERTEDGVIKVCISWEMVLPGRYASTITAIGADIISFTPPA